MVPTVDKYGMNYWEKMGLTLHMAQLLPLDVHTSNHSQQQTALHTTTNIAALIFPKTLLPELFNEAHS